MGGVCGNAVHANGALQNANREIGVPGFQLPTSTSEFRFDEFTFAPFHRPSLNPARAPAVSAVLLLLEAGRLVSAERLLAVFQIDAGDKSLPSLWPAAQISQQGSAAREDGASGPPVDAVTVAAFVVAAADAAAVAAEAAVAAGVAIVVAIAVAPPVAFAAVDAAAVYAAAAEFVVAVAPLVAAGMLDAAAFAAGVSVVLVVAVAMNVVAAAPVVAVGPLVAGAVAVVVAVAVLARRPAGRT